MDADAFVGPGRICSVTPAILDPFPEPTMRCILRCSASLGLLAALAACSPGDGPRATEEGQPDNPLPAGAPERAAPLVPMEASFNEVNALVRDPMQGELASVAEDTVLARHIRLGYQIVENTPEHAPEFVGNTLSCGNCHLNAGQRDRALPYVGIAGLFPQHRSRAGRLISLEDRIRGCFARSMNGTPPPYDSPELMAVAAYITWLSADLPIGENPAWRGRNVIAKEKLIPIERLDVDRGEQLYAQQCAACHGLDGQGVDLQVAKPGPLWGPNSWNDGAGAARIYTLAGYIRYAMPLTAPGSLSDEESQHIAAYINSKPRPVFATKASDYPDGGVPIDAVYYPQRYDRNPLMR